MTETELKQQLKTGTLLPVYFLYGEEPYLTMHYAERIAGLAVPEDGFAEFNLQKFDAKVTPDALTDAVEALPLMAERKCVWVRDLDVAAGGKTAERALALMQEPSEDCTLLFTVTGFVPDMKKSARWKAFAKAAEQHGAAVCFPRLTGVELQKLLQTGAKKRGCVLQPRTANRLAEQCGSDLYLLLGELSKLAAIAGEGGEITEQLVEQAATHTLTSSVYDLSKALLRRRYDDAYDCIHRLTANREEPVRVLAVLASAYADLYRVKVAQADGLPPTRLADSFSYRGREFRLRYAADDCRRLSLQTLRDSMEVLADADAALKSSSANGQRVLEQTAARLILLQKMA